MKIGIIDVGGGTRGIFGAGVLDYLIDNNIEIPYCIGISAGSGNMARYISKDNKASYIFYTKYAFTKEYMSWRNYFVTGNFVNLNYIYGTLSNEGADYPLDYEKLMDSQQELVVVATCAEDGKPVYFTKKDIEKNDYRIFACSSCLPVLCEPYYYEDHYYYDGAISNPIPVEKAFEDGCDKVIVILTRPIDFIKSDGKKYLFYNKVRKRFPEFTKVLEKRCDIYNNQLKEIKEKYVENGKVLLIAPDSTKGLKTLSKDKKVFEKLYQEGYKKGELIKDFIK
ncbi:MAG: patatin family protein [Bacilli bacterium]|nr:patatin family protein [Bacilli bacterium]